MVLFACSLSAVSLSLRVSVEEPVVVSCSLLISDPLSLVTPLSQKSPSDMFLTVTNCGPSSEMCLLVARYTVLVCLWRFCSDPYPFCECSDTAAHGLQRDESCGASLLTLEDPKMLPKVFQIQAQSFPVHECRRRLVVRCSHVRSRLSFYLKMGRQKCSSQECIVIRSTMRLEAK